MTTNTYNYSKAKRQDMIKAGAYDGRYKQRVIKDKKKEQSRNWAREKY
jgi:hypothetical protein